jgi:hypothetical protein
MAAVRFCSACDVCGAASSEYSAFPTCIYCGDEVCIVHCAPGSADDETGRCVCIACEAELEAEKGVR